MVLSPSASTTDITVTQLRVTLRAVREDLRDLDCHPLVGELVTALSEADQPLLGLVKLAYALEIEFAREELSLAFCRLALVLDQVDASSWDSETAVYEEMADMEELLLHRQQEMRDL